MEEDTMRRSKKTENIFFLKRGGGVRRLLL